MEEIRKLATRQQFTRLLNWLRHKDQNPWIFQCLSRATTKMNHRYWDTTSNSTNIAESAHALSQRHGTNLTLVAAIKIARNLDFGRADSQNAMRRQGIAVRYGDNSIAGRTKRNLNRAKAVEKRRQKAQEDGQDVSSESALAAVVSSIAELTKAIREEREERRS